MGILDWLSNKKKAKRELTLTNTNIAFNLPFTKIGDVFSDSDYFAKQITSDTYEIKIYNNLFSHNHEDKVIIVKAVEMKMIYDGMHMPHYGLYRPTKEELKELKELEEEMVRWRKSKKLNCFKQLPSHLRQEIVDEAMLKSLMQSNEADPLYQEFEGWNRLTELRNKKGENHLRSNVIHREIDRNKLQYKYLPIILRFSLDELMEAHASASLEDEISN